jgi:hypothetical protein
MTAAAATMSRIKRTKRMAQFEPRYWSTKQAADHFGVCAMTLKRWVKDPAKGLRPSLVINNVWFFTPESIKAFELRHAPADEAE